MPKLYTDEGYDRFFLVPDDVTLKKGVFHVASIEGPETDVDLADIARFEVPEHVARKQAQEILARARGMTRKINDVAGALKAVTEAADKPAPTDPAEVRRALASIGIPERLLQEDPMQALKVLGKQVKSAVEKRIGPGAFGLKTGGLRDEKSIWMDEQRKRFFLIPDNVQLLPGSLAIYNAAGDTKRVDKAVVAAYEVTREEMGARARSQLGDVLETFQKVITATRSKEQSEPLPEPLEKIADAFRGLLGGLEKALRDASEEPAAAATPTETAETKGGSEPARDRFADLPARMAQLSDAAMREFVEGLTRFEYEAAALAMRSAKERDVQRFARIAKSVVVARAGDDAWATMAAALGVDPDAI